MNSDDICFTEAEVAQILWVMTDAAEHATEARAFSSLVLIEERFESCVRDSMIAEVVTNSMKNMLERVKVTEAARQTGVAGTEIFLAIRHGTISTVLDDRGYDWVDLDEVRSLARS